MVKLSVEEHLKMKADKQNKSVQNEIKSVDYTDTDIIKKALYNSKIESENRNTENKYDYEDQKFDFEFHEQFFS